MGKVYHAIQLLLFPSRVCTNCSIEKPLDEFYKSSTGRGGYQTWCKDCWNEWRRLKRRQNIQNPPERELLIAQVCKQCGNKKPIDAFYVDPLSTRGYRATCKDCVDSKDKRRKNPGKRRNRRGIPVTPGYKWCYGCESEKLFSEFRKDETKWDGYYPRCDTCRLAQRRIHWHENTWHLLPAERLRHRTRYEADIEESRAYNREKGKKPQARLRSAERSRKRSARRKYATVGEVNYQHILARDGYWCYICERDIDPTIKRGPARLTFDHVVSLYHHGTHAEDNIKPAHLICNQRKNRYILEDMTSWQRRGPDV